MQVTKCCFVWMFLGLVSLAWLVGCADREAEVVSAPGSTAKADAALEKAEQIMEDAGIDISFNNLAGLESLTDLRQILPSPLEISILEDNQVDAAVSALYEVLGELGQPTVPAAPSLLPDEISQSDLAMVHLHLGYLYVVGAVARLERVKGDLYIIDFPEDLNTEDTAVYEFELTEQGQARIDAVAAAPNAMPEDYLPIFSPGQRQAILDSLRLLAGAQVVVEAHPDLGIPNEERHFVSEAIYPFDALYHLDKALTIAEVIIPELEDALDELYDAISEYLVLDMLDQVREWGFRVDNEDEIRARIDRIVR